MNLKEMHETALGWKELKEDYTRSPKDLHFGHDGNSIYIMVSQNLIDAEMPLFMENHAMWQVCQKLGPPPYRYIAACPPELAVTNLEYWREVQPDDRVWFVREFYGRVRAVMSDRYLPVGIDTVLGWAVETIGDVDMKLIRTSLTPDYMHIRAMVYTGDPNDNYGYGVYIGENEIGKGKLKVASLIQRHSCQNSIIVDDGDFMNIVHRAGQYTIGELRTLFKVKMNVALRTAVETRDAIARAEAEKIESFASVLRSITNANGFSEETSDNVLIGTEGQETRMGIVNGLSFAAKQVEDEDESVAMEILAGKILVSDDSLFGQAMNRFREVEI